MSANSSRGLALKAAIVQACRDLYPDVETFWGYPGSTYPREAIAVTDVRSVQEVATLGNRRSRREQLEIDLFFVVTVQGSVAFAQQDADTRCMELLNGVEFYLRDTNTTLDNLVLWCALSSYQMEGFTPEEQRSAGFAAQITATFAAEARITTL